MMFASLNLNVAISVIFNMSREEKRDGRKDGDPMKLNKTILKEAIREELALLENEGAGKLRSSEVGRHATDQRKAMSQGGIDDKERSAIATVSKKLAAAAKAGNIMSGTLARRLQQLVVEIDKVLGGEQQPQQGAQE